MPPKSNKPKKPKELLRLAFIPGMVPDKWFKRFDSRHPGHRIAAANVPDAFPYIRSGQVDGGFVRLDSRGRGAFDLDEFHLIEIYDEQPGVAVPKEHPIAVFDSVQREDLTDEIINYEPGANGSVDSDAVKAALDIVAANVGVVIAPRPLLRHFNGRQVVDVALADGQPTTIAFVWRRDRDDELIQDLVGIFKGRTSQSSR